jgi:hypothetical protein
MVVCTAPMLYFLVIKICTALDHVEFTNNMKTFIFNTIVSSTIFIKQIE